MQSVEEIQERLKELEAALKTIEIKKEKKVNVFAAAGMTTQEIKHSAFFAWLADAQKPHDLGSLFLRKFCEKLALYETDGDGAKQNAEIIGDKFSRLETFLNDKYEVVTEKVVVDKESRIDVFIASAAAKTVIVIENKVFTSAHDNQLQRYENEINAHSEYKKYDKIYVYLTPSGELPCGAKNEYDTDWCVFDYDGVCDIVKEIHSSLKSSKKDARLKILLEDYMELIDTDILKKNKVLRNECKRILREHKEALDILMSYTDNAEEVIAYCKERLESDCDGFTICKETPLGFRFYTRAMKEYLERNGESLLSENKVSRIGVGMGCTDGPVGCYCGLDKGRDEVWSDALKKIMLAAAPNKKQGYLYFTISNMVILPAEDRAEPFENVKRQIDLKLKEWEAKLKKFDELLASL